MSWIRGRFEGTTIGEPVDREPGRDGARRYHVKLHSGRVHEPERVPEPPDAHEAAYEEIRQDRVRGVLLPGALTGGEPGERTLFDVRIRDFRLEHPVEANGRSYAKVIGTILARMVPAPEPALAIAPDAPRSPPPQPDAEKPPALPSRTHDVADSFCAERPELGLAADDQISILKRLLAIAFVLVGATLIGLACGLRTAALWAAPVALVMLVCRVVRPAPVRTPAVQWWIGGGAVVFQLGVLFRPMEAAWQLGCRAPIRDDLLWLAAPIAVAALVRNRSPLYATTLVWTGVLCTWCAQLDGTCQPGALLAAPPTVAVPAPPRTDSEGRWPVMPPPVLPGGQGSLDGGIPSSGLAVPEPALSSADEGPAPARALAPQSTRRSPPAREGKGGWASPDHRRTPREMVLISVEQANRTPQSFFGSEGARRVYLPSDRVFEPDSADVSARGALQLTRLAALLSLHPERRVALDVHTDAAGAPQAQHRLSQRRAGSLQAWLVDHGHIDAEQLDVQGLGGSRPIVPPDGSYEDQGPNRRIEVRLVD